VRMLRMFFIGVRGENTYTPSKLQKANHNLG